MQNKFIIAKVFKDTKYRSLFFYKENGGFTQNKQEAKVFDLPHCINPDDTNEFLIKV